MHKLKEVEDAKALMLEASAKWSVMRWLAEKKKVRKAADQANDTLDELHRNVKAAWSDDLKAAYAALSGDGKSNHANHVSAEAKLFAKHQKQADDEAYQARMTAEDTFDRAERRLSTSMAREGARQAIISWELFEIAIAKAEAGVSSTKVTS